METLKNNLLIAEFMGYPYYQQDVYEHIGGPIEGDAISVGDVVCKTKPSLYESHGLTFIASNDYRRIPNWWYDHSWDELMPVIQKINEILPKVIPNNVILPDYMVKMRDLPLFIFWKEDEHWDLKQAYECCLEFIIWYKENKDEL